MSAPRLDRRLGWMAATLHALVALSLFREAFFEGEVLSQADFLLRHEPWASVAPADFEPGNPSLSDQSSQFLPWRLYTRERLAGRSSAGRASAFEAGARADRGSARDPGATDAEGGGSAARGPEATDAGGADAARVGQDPADAVAEDAAGPGAVEPGLPWWNPRAGCGEPFIANFQSAVFSPYAIWHLLLPLRWAELALACTKLLLAGVGTALLVRLLGAGRVAALMASLGYTLGGFQLGWLGHPHSAVSALLPWLLCVAELAVQRAAAFGGEKPRSDVDARRDVHEPAVRAPTDSPATTRPPLRHAGVSAAFAALVAAMLLAGHVETAFHVSVAVALWTLVRLAASTQIRVATRLVVAAALFAASLLGLAIAAVQVVPFVEYLMHSTAWAKRHAFQELWRRPPWDAGFELGMFALLALSLCVLFSILLRVRRGPRLVVTAAALAFTLAVTLARAEELGFGDAYRLLMTPDRDGHPVPARGLAFAGERAYVNVNGAYVGLATLPFALFALVGARARRPRAVFALFVLWAFSFAVAYDVPVLGYLVNSLPGFSSSLNDRFMLIVGLAGAALAGIGVDALARGPRAWTRPPSTFVAVLAAIGAGVALSPTLAGTRAPELPAPRTPPAVVGASARPEPGPPFGQLAPVPEPHRAPAPFVVTGWALDDGGAPEVVLELIQGERREVRRLDADDYGEAAPAWPPPAALDAYPTFERAGFAATFDLDAFDGGRVWLRATLVDATGARTVVYDQSFRYLPRYPISRVTIALAVATAGVLALGLVRRRDTDRRGPLVLAATFAVVLVDLHHFARDFNPSAPPAHVFPATPTTDFLRAQPGRFRVHAVDDALLMPNTASVYGLEDVRRYDAVGVDGYTLFLEALRPLGVAAFSADAGLDLAHPLFELLGVRFVLARAGFAPPPGARLREVFADGEARVYATPYDGTRAFLVPTARSIAPYLDALPELDRTPEERHRRLAIATGLGSTYRAELDWRRVLLVEADDVEPMPLDRTELAAELARTPPVRGDVVERRWGPERIELTVRSDRPAWLLVTETFAPGWTASVDGAPAEVVPAFFAFRAVRVGAGESEVVLEYRPASTRWGAAGSFAGLAGLLALGVAAARGRREALSGSG